MYVSVFTLMVVSIERWRAVSDPLSHPIWRTHQVIVLIWIVSSLLSLPEPFTLEIYPADYSRKTISTTVGGGLVASCHNYRLYLQFHPLTLVRIMTTSFWDELRKNFVQ